MPFNVNEIDLGLLVENMPDLIFYLDMDKKLLSFNAGGNRFLKMIGCHDPSPGDDVLAFFPEKKRKFLLHELDQLKTGKVFSFEDVFPDDQNTCYFDISLYALAGVTGEQIGFCVLLRDTTDKRQVEAKYRRLFHDNPMVIYVIRLKDLGILEVNEAAIKQYGFSREEFLQKTALDWRLKEDQEKLREYLLNVQMGADDGPAGVWRHVLKTGEHIFMEICLHRTRYNNEDAVMTIAQNVTDKLELERRLEEERFAQHKRLTEAIIKAQETERAELSMELHDNVNQILGASRLYLSAAKKSPPARKTELIDKSAGYILDAIEEIRRLCKSLVSPLQRLLTLEMGIQCLAEDVMCVYDLSIKTEICNFESAELNDKFKLNLFRIVQEQLNNIIKHANAANVTIVLSATDNGIRVEITDDGQGFDTALQRKGIGLSNIQSRAELYNGSMEVVSAPGEGCRLVVEFAGREGMG
ncbi:PAS domain S-box protein [Terrimonas sp. NA20]|uniref:PAS domain S-box protein n=1 Tax=Terrimonas ginsenosidimutans TaxID=2908004 RepID=A0ABS9KKA6_9BACT|nr:PAS domain S-box protein [Terrimonas ginsenosidimutans]MCG2612762.1 PAS domain S-box protein [Terrimonas ginsenosidimutans]